MAASVLRGWYVTALRLSSAPQAGSVVIEVDGDLDIVTSREFDDYLTKARRGPRHLIIDLSAVTFMDTSSLAVIVGHWKKLMSDGGSLALAGARYRHTKTLWITGLAHRLPLYDTAEEAVAALPAAPSSRDG